LKNIYGLIGFPLGHSFSAKFFAEKFEREGISAEYRNFAIPSIDELPAVLATPNLRGFNVTIPYKQAILPHLAAVSPQAEEIGAVNVVRVEKDGRLTGHNTDIIGFVRSIRPLLQPWHRGALVLGTGGASKAVVVGLKALGLEPQLVSRTPREGIIAYADITADVLSRFPVVVNCSPVGMFPNVDAAPAIPYDLLTSQNLLYDLVYNPEETLFLRRGREQGAATKNGLEMLHLQALAAWEIWQK